MVDWILGERLVKKLKGFVVFIGLLSLIFTSTPIRGQTQPGAERIALAALRNGYWDIYSIAPDGSDPRQLTNDPFEDTDPVYAPDGAKIAFASRRDNNWDVYVLNLLTGEQTRLTNSPHYDGAPTWSPGGERLAYESYQAGDLDIWLIDAAGSEPAINLTDGSTASDFAPAWNPTGDTIAFTSWREGDKDLFLVDVNSGDVTRLTNSSAAEEWPAWHPNGQTLAFVGNDLGDREVFTLSVANRPAEGGLVQPVTWLGRTDGPAWSPDGGRLATVFHRWDEDIISIQGTEDVHELPQWLDDVSRIQGRLTWRAQAINFGEPVASLLDTGPSRLYEERLTPNEPGAEPYNLLRLNDVDTGTPWLADTVDDSFLAWRFRLRDEVGYDFLSQLSDALRDVGQYSETSQYASWHKSGRAIDTLFDYHLNGQLAHEIVREDYSGETYWRIYLRCADQNGRCGRPLTANAWNYSARARTEIAPEQGGIEKSNFSGYYVDMTALARDYGWDRISSFDDEEYSWTWHFLAFEYWHYQKRLERDSPLADRVSSWYQAMRHVYPQETLDRFFTWQQMREIGENPHLIALKGVPLSLEAKPWWTLIEQ